MKGNINIINDNIKLLSRTEYDNLSTEKKNNGTIYFVESDDGSYITILKNDIDCTGPLVSTTAKGLMTASDKVKLNKVKLGEGVASDDLKNNFRTIMNGSSSVGEFLRVYRAGTTKPNVCDVYDASLGFGCYDTHGYIQMRYSDPSCIVGGGSANKLVWTRHMQFKEDLDVELGPEIDA